LTLRTTDVEPAHTDSPLLAVLAGLKETPLGAVIYDQIGRLLEEQESAQRSIDRAYTMLLRVLLDTYARNPSLEQVNRINSKLGELRAVLSAPAPTLPPALEVPVAASAPAERGDVEPELDLNRVLEQLLGGLPHPAEAPDLSQPEPVTAPAAAMADATPVEPPAATVTDSTLPEPAPIGQAERRVNSAYRLHLDRKRDEIAKLQEAFAQNVSEAITQNREFGALLQIELNALQQADGAQEIETLRQILIGGIEELIQGQRALDTKLHRTSGYLDLIKSDSDRLRDELNKVRLLSLTDEFTGLPNRRAFMRRLQDEIGRAQRYGSPLALALLDLDEFKAVNDVYGHAAGDEVLRAYAANVLSILRHHDLVARYGGEEFAVLLPNTALPGAIAALNKAKARAQEVSCTFDGKSLRVPTFSAGLTLYVPGDMYTTLIDRADRALYRAKRLGRNRVEVEPSVEGTAPAPGRTTDTVS
jgi:diguanylate cyclase (GGDEF)-like protein